MASDPKIDQIKSQLDQVASDDAAEDAAYESKIANLTQLLATVTAERDQLALEKTVTIADLIEVRDSLSARITALGG